jgi:hypothetical protein
MRDNHWFTFATLRHTIITFQHHTGTSAIAVRCLRLMQEKAKARAYRLLQNPVKEAIAYPALFQQYAFKV